MIFSRNRISRQNQPGRAVSSAFGPGFSMAADTPGSLCCRNERVRLIRSELSRCARFYVAIVHAISCHLPSVLSSFVVVPSRYEETRTYRVRTAVCTTSMNANGRHWQTHNIRCSSSSRRAKLLAHTAATSSNQNHSR